MQPPSFSLLKDGQNSAQSCSLCAHFLSTIKIFAVLHYFPLYPIAKEP